jgi:hypothetical protein
MRRSFIFLSLSACLLATTGAMAQHSATPTASPVASPVAEDPCAGLEPYLLSLAALTGNDPALTTLREVGFDALALSSEEADAVVADLSLLISQVESLETPAAASGYQRAYLAMLGWYRDLAQFRDPASHQRLINNDRQLFANLGIAVQQGQVACGYERWNDAFETAFPG